MNEITTTPTHPFYTAKNGWTAAIDLRAGDILLTVNGEQVIVEEVSHELLESPVTVYNFEVEGLHTYFVGTDNVLVHNACAGTQIKGQNTPDQDAVIQLAKGTQKAGVSMSDAETLVQWSKEYGINNHSPMIHPGRSGLWSEILHIKIANMHIPVVK